MKRNDSNSLVYNILIIDDDHDVHDLLEMALEQINKRKSKSLLQNLDNSSSTQNMDIKVFHAYQGRDAINLFNEKFLEGINFDLIILDILMPPGINGAETLHEITKIKKENKVIISSAYFHDLKEEILKNADGCESLHLIKKPYSINSFKTIVKSILIGDLSLIKNSEATVLK